MVGGFRLVRVEYDDAPTDIPTDTPTDDPSDVSTGVPTVMSLFGF